MSTTRSPVTCTRVSSPDSKAMIVGIALVATGGLISLCGMAVSGTAIATRIRRWVIAQQEPPSAIVKRKIAQARAATAAGANAWHNGMAAAARQQ